MHIAYKSHFGGLRGHGGLPAASMAPEVKFDFRFLISYLNYPAIHVHNAHNNNFGGLWGYGSLQTASEVISGLRIGLSDLNYPCRHVLLACKCLHEMIHRTTTTTLIIIH